VIHQRSTATVTMMAIGAIVRLHQKPPPNRHGLWSLLLTGSRKLAKGSRAQEAIRDKPEMPHFLAGELDMGRKPRLESESIQYAFDRFIGKDPVRIASSEEELVNAELSRKIMTCERRRD